MYLYHLISIDLESSRSCNSSHCKAYTYEPGLHCLLHQVKQSSFKKSLLPPHLQCLELLQIPNQSNIEHRTSVASNIDHIEHQSYWTLIALNIDHTKRTTRPTDNWWPTNQIKSLERQNKVFTKTPIGPCLTPQILKIITTNESKVNVILDKPSDWL